MIAWMDGELLPRVVLGVVLLAPKNNRKPNLTYANITKCNKKIISGQKIKAKKKIIIGRREYLLCTKECKGLCDGVRGFILYMNRSFMHEGVQGLCFVAFEHMM